MLDLAAQFQTIESEIKEKVDQVLESQRFILGPEVSQCEEAIAQYSNCAYGVGVSSGTDALLLSLMVADIQPGDEVITTPYTFFATAGSIARLGAIPVFVDIDPRTYNIDVHQIEKQITKKTKALLPVHLYGQMASMDSINQIAEQYHLTIIEDAAQSIGARYQNQKAGSCGHLGCFSFFPSKNLGAYGDGGMVVTQSAELAEKLRVFRAHGSKPKYYHQYVGGNFRLDALQAAIINIKLPYLDQWSHQRRRNADTYHQLLQELVQNDPSKLSLPFVNPECHHVYNQYVIRTPYRDALKEFLKGKNIQTEIYYPVPMHQQACFRSLNVKAHSLEESEKAAKETLALPVYPELQSAQIEYVVDCIKTFFKNQ